jgi:hypothetical protein
VKRLVLLALTLLLVAGCTTIPSSSSPLVVRTLPRAAASDSPRPNVTPQPGAGPFDIVNTFVLAGVDADAGHSTARQFLTNTAARKWQDNPTVILDETNVGDATISGDTATVAVSGRRVGMLDAGGIFSPTLKGMGAGDEETFNFRLTRVGGQWRIEQLQPGVLISQAAFAAYYRLRKLYFFDSTETILVPDPRYSPLEGQPLASWLLNQLLAGPRPELAQSVLNEAPDQVGKPSVQVGNPIVAEMPGTAQLDAAGRNGLAAQLAFTLGQVQFAGAELQLTDSGKTVRVPAASGALFSTANFTAASPDNVVPGVRGYFVRYGALFDDTGVAVPNPLGQQARNFSSVAVRRTSSESLQVAGVTAAGQFVIGDEHKLSTIKLPVPAASRPDWRPYADDVWLGAGDRGAIYRITNGQSPRPVSVSSQVGGLPLGKVIALRLSPDGVRVALVIRGQNGRGTAWVGSVVTSGSDVRVDSLEPITPPAMTVTDLAWSDPTRLLLVAAAPGAEAKVWQVLSDGSQLAGETTAGLPGSPTSIAGASQQEPLVAANGLILKLEGSSWQNLTGTASAVSGANPVYAF